MKNKTNLTMLAGMAAVLSACGGGNINENTNRTNAAAPLRQQAAAEVLSAVPIDPAMRIAGSYNHTLAASTDGKVYSWGRNEFGQLGNDSFRNSNTPIAIPNMSGIRAVRAGYGHSTALKLDGTVWTWGNNTFGQLGYDNYAEGTTTRPRNIWGLSNVKAISSGYSHNLALTNNGGVWGWGRTPVSYTRQPANISNLSGVKAISSGASHNLALRNDGAIFAWGDNRSGQLGNGSIFSSANPTFVQGLSNVKAVSAGSKHTLALGNDGSVYAWGSNEYYQLGNTGSSALRPLKVAGLRGVIAISAGAFNSAALLGNGSVVTWGNNLYGQLGNGSTGSNTSSAAPRQVAIVSNAVALSSANGYLMVTTADGSVYGVGQNTAGQLGNHTVSNTSLPTQTVGLSGVRYLNLGRVNR